MPTRQPRINREKKTVAAMIELYCRQLHYSREGLCIDCKDISDYARVRLTECPFQEGKTTCVKCKVHCYKDAKRDKIKEIMRYSGPRMLKIHPVLTIHHMIDGLRSNPRRKSKTVA